MALLVCTLRFSVRNAFKLLSVVLCNLVTSILVQRTCRNGAIESKKMISIPGHCLLFL
uniref:Uncharacterized protein n=1 Tax=Arundo donax TaxID=35708 RepID=A0A0A9GUV4_ARUDO